jgi:hypothetical protein
MSKPMIRIYDCETNQTIDREMNDTEFAKWQLEQIALEENKAQAKAEAEAKAVLLERLGITADEAKLLLA